MSSRPRHLDTSPPRRRSDATPWRRLLLVALLLGSATVARADTEYYAISPASLQVRDPVLHYSYINTTEGYFHTEGVESECNYAPVHLPDGATIIGLVMYYEDTGAWSVAADIRRKSVDSEDGTEPLGYVESTGSSSGIHVAVDLSIANPVVDLEHYVYFAVVCLPPAGVLLHGLYLSFTR